MKFQMAPHSLFAILLRQPWWVSLLVAVLLGLVSAALLPADLKLGGALGGMPFVVLSLIALKRQWGQPGAREIERVDAAVRQMPWESFRAALQRGLVRDGYEVSPGSGAVDLVLRKDGRQTLVAARRWKAARQGEEVLQGLQAAAVEAGAGSVMLVALGELTPGAQRLAQAHGVSVVGAAQLARWLRGVPLPEAGGSPAPGKRAG